MIPSAWVSVVLALAAFRLSRLVGWDDLPPIARARAWVVGEKVTHTGSGNAHMGLTADRAGEDVEYRRPTLSHFLHCAFCAGFWICVLEYGAWLWEPRWTLYALFPFALNGASGLIAKDLDP